MFKRILSVALAGLMAISVPLLALATDVSIGLRDDRPVDILLATGSTDYDLEQFKAKMENALRAAGVDLKRVKLATVESTNSATMDNFPWNLSCDVPGKLSMNGGTIRLAGDPESGYTGKVYYRPEGVEKISKFAVNFTLDPSQCKPHTIKYACFEFGNVALSLDIQSAGSATVLLNYPGCGVPYEYINYVGSTCAIQGINIGSIHGSTDFRLEITKSDVKLYGNGSLMHQASASGIKLQKLLFCVDHNQHDCPEISTFTMSGVSLELTNAKDLIEVVRAPDWRPDSHRFIVDVNDECREDFEEDSQIGELMDRLVADGAYYIGWGQPVNASEMNTFIKRNAGKGTVFSSSDHTVEQKTANYIEPIVNGLAAGSNRQTVLSTRAFKYQVDPLSLAQGTANAAWPNGKWRINYSNQYQEGLPWGGTTAFKFLGVTESPFWTDRYAPNFTFSTAQVGAYSLTFEDTPISPSLIVVHQKPVMQVQKISFTPSGGKYKISAKLNFYDPDNKNLNINGPTEAQGVWHGCKLPLNVKYRPAGLNSSVWKSLAYSFDKNTNTFTTEAVPFGQYEVYLSATDLQGEESNVVIKYIDLNSNNFDTKPIASFAFTNSKMTLYNWSLMLEEGNTSSIFFSNVLQDLSHDPLGKSLKSWKWEWFDEDGNSILTPYTYTNTNSPNAFKNFLNSITSKGPGTYYLGLVVTRSSGGNEEQRTSELYKRVIEFTREPYAIWFSDRYNAGRDETGLFSTPSASTYRMEGFNKNNVWFATTGTTKPRTVTFNKLKASPYVTENIHVGIRDTNIGMNDTDVRVTVKKYPINLNSEYMWPVSSNDMKNGIRVISLGGTPTDDWGLLSTHKTTTGLPYYVTPDNMYYYNSTNIGYGQDLRSFCIMSTTHEEVYEWNARTPENKRTANSMYSPTLKRSWYKWEDDTWIDVDGKYEISGNIFYISVPSRISSIKLQGTGGYIGTKKYKVGGVYFKDKPANTASVGSAKQGFISMQNTSDYITVSLPKKGADVYKYFYVMPETALAKGGETYTDSGLTNQSYNDDVYASKSYTVRIRRLNDDVRLRVNGSEMLEATRVVPLTSMATSYKLNLQMIDPKACINGWRVNDSSTYHRAPADTNSMSITATGLHVGRNKITITVNPEDRELYRTYTVYVDIPDTKWALDADVSYDAKGFGTYVGVFDASAGTYTITMPENVRNGKLNINAKNPTTVVTKLDSVEYNSNGISVDYPLPKHSNPNAVFGLHADSTGQNKQYTIIFKKQNNPVSATLVNGDKLDGIFSPQGRLLAGVYTPYAKITDAGAAYNGNGVPIEIKVTNPEMVQGISGEVVFKSQTFPIHWGSYDGPTYIDGSTTLNGFAVIDAEALSGLNGLQQVSCTLREYDDVESSALYTVSYNLKQIKVDSQGPTLSYSANPSPPKLNLMNITDNLTKAVELRINYGPQGTSGYEDHKTYDISASPNLSVDCSGITGPYRFMIEVADLVGNVSQTDEFVIDFSANPGSDFHMEFGRNADGYYHGVRKDDDSKLGLDRFGFLP